MVKELNFIASFPKSYPESQVPKTIKIEGVNGAPMNNIELSVEGKDKDLFKLSISKIADRSKKGNPKKNVIITYLGKQTQTEKVEAVLKAQYEGKVFELPLSGVVKLGEEDVIIPPTKSYPEASLEVSYFGKDIKNGSTIKFLGVVGNKFQGECFSPKVLLKLHGVSLAEVEFEKPFQIPLKWCVSGGCIVNSSNENPWKNPNAINQGEHYLELDFPYSEVAKSGYKNKVKVLIKPMGEGVDNFELFLEFDIK